MIIFLAFYRLAINGLDKRSGQPLKYNNKILICNGEIYNYQQLYELMGIKSITNSDCEVIIHLYEKYGIEYAINCLDGVFAFVLIDNDLDKIYIGRDPFGVRPLFIISSKNKNKEWCEISEQNMLGFASEMKQLYNFTYNIDSIKYNGENNLFINEFEPGTYMELEKKENNKWIIENHNRYANFHLTRINPENSEMNMQTVINNIHDIFCEAVYKESNNY